MMQEIRTDEELPVLTAKDERLRVSGYRCCMSNQTTMFCHVGKITSSGEECPPSFPVTVSEVVAVKEQMCQVIGRVNAQVPAGDNEGEEERGNVSSGLREAEKHVVPVNNPFPYAELGNCIAARRKGIVKEPDKFIVSFKEVVYGSVKPVIDDAAVGFCLCNELLKPILHILKQGEAWHPSFRR